MRLRHGFSTVLAQLPAEGPFVCGGWLATQGKAEFFVCPRRALPSARAAVPVCRKSGFALLRIGIIALGLTAGRASLSSVRLSRVRRKSLRADCLAKAAGPVWRSVRRGPRKRCWRRMPAIRRSHRALV